MRSPGGGRVAGITGAGFGRARAAAAGFLAFATARLAGAFLAGFFAAFLRATGRLAGAFFFALAFAFFRTAIPASVVVGVVATCYSKGVTGDQWPVDAKPIGLHPFSPAFCLRILLPPASFIRDNPLT